MALITAPTSILSAIAITPKGMDAISSATPMTFLMISSFRAISLLPMALMACRLSISMGIIIKVKQMTCI